MRIEGADRSVVTGHLVVPFAPDSQRITVCEASRAPCSGANGDGVMRMEVATLRDLAVWGRMTGISSYRGAFLGGLIGGGADSGWRDTNGVGMLLGFLAGGVLGHAIGARTHGWVDVLGCFHGCAHGEYPER